MEFIPVQSYNNYVEAHIAMGNLQQQHINCWLKDEYTVTIDPILSNAVGGIKLMVAKVQAPRAIALLKEAEHKQQYSCPHCGSRDIQLRTIAPQKKEHWLVALFKILIGGNTTAPTQIWHCCTCNKDCKQPSEIHATATEDVG